MKFLLVLLFVAVAFFATGEAIKCYACSPPETGCNDPFKKTDAVKESTCPESQKACVKETVELSNGTIVTSRSCFIAPTISRVPERADAITVVATSTHFCQEDLCNGVSATSAALSTLIVLAVPLVFANYH